MTEREQIAQLEQQIRELEARLPRHSTPPAMLLALESLEDQLAELMQRTQQQSAWSPG